MYEGGIGIVNTVLAEGKNSILFNRLKITLILLPIHSSSVTKPSGSIGKVKKKTKTDFIFRFIDLDFSGRFFDSTDPENDISILHPLTF